MERRSRAVFFIFVLFEFHFDHSFTMKKTFVLLIMFVLPVVAYMFFASGVTNFGRLPILTTQVSDVASFQGNITLENKISVLGFLGEDIENKKGIAFNLNQKIYKRFNGFDDFQFVMVVPNGAEEKVNELKKELGSFSDIDNWNFVYGSKSQIKSLFDALKTDLRLDEGLATQYVFIIDKERNLRGRNDDIDEGVKYGFNANSVADLNNKMEDDVKIILAEYRMALKKNDADRSK